MTDLKFLKHCDLGYLVENSSRSSGEMSVQQKSESGRPCFISDLKKKFQSFTIESNVSCEFLINSLYCIEDISFYSQCSEYFYHERLLDVIKWFFCLS